MLTSHNTSVSMRLRNAKSHEQASYDDTSYHHHNISYEHDRFHIQLHPFLARLYREYKRRPKFFKLLLLLLLILYFWQPQKIFKEKPKPAKKKSLRQILSKLSYTEVTILHKTLNVTPFPSDIDFTRYDSETYIRTMPIKIDVVYSYGGSINDLADPRRRDNNELKYSMRSVHTYLPWINAIFLVVPDQLAIKLEKSSLFPSWLDVNKLPAHKVRFIAQSSIFHERENGKNNHNSNAVEMNLHRIPGLSEHFIYMNDDFFIGRPLPYNFFFNDKFIPRWPYNHYMKYYWMDRRERKRTKYANCYNYDVEELRDKPVPHRVDYYRTHAPRALTKGLMHQYVDEMYYDFFMFMESHKTRWCSSPTIMHTIKNRNWKYLKKLLSLRLHGSSWYETNDCSHEETFFLTLFKQYVDNEDIVIDIMEDPPAQYANVPTNYYVYGIPIEQKCADIMWFRPFTFNINDDYDTTNEAMYKKQLSIVHKFFERYFPDPAPWEIR